MYVCVLFAAQELTLMVILGGSLIKNKFHLVFIFLRLGKVEKNVSQRIVKRNVF